MNILIINSFFSGGGAEKVARQLYEGLKIYNGINLYFLSGRGNSRGEIENIYITGEFAYLYNRVCCFAANNQRKKNRYVQRKIIRIIMEKKIDIIHLHNIHGNYMGIFDVVELSKYCKIIWTLHDMWALTGHCAYSLDCSKWVNNECRECPYMELYPKMRLDVAHDRYLSKRKAFVGKKIFFVTPSVWLKNMCDRSFLYKEDITVINNGVNTNIYKLYDRTALRKKYHVSDEKIIIMFVANQLNNPYKGASTLVKALNNIENKAAYELLICGNGEAFPVSSAFTIHHMGYIKDERQMSELYNVADVFIVPSIAENYPCVVLESIASGTPVIGCDTGGMKEQISPSLGWKFPVDDDICLKRIIEQLDQETLKNMRKNCREVAEREFDERTMLNNYYILYKKVLND